MTKKRPGWNLRPATSNGADPKQSKDGGDATHKACGNVAKTIEGKTTYYVPAAQVALNSADQSNGEEPSPFDEAEVLEQTLKALRGGHVKPFLEGYHHVLDMYRQRKKAARRRQSARDQVKGFISRAQKHTFLYSNEDAPRPRKTWFTTTVLWLVKIYAFWMGGLLPIPESCSRGRQHDNHGKRPRWGLSQLFNEVPGFGSAANTGPALTFYLSAGLHLGLPFGTLIHVLSLRVYSAGVGALGPVPSLWGDPFMASKLQAELHIANIMETWVDLRTRTEDDAQLSDDDPLYHKKHGRWRSEELSKIFYMASDGQIQDITYSNSFRKAIWGHYM